MPIIIVLSNILFKTSKFECFTLNVIENNSFSYTIAVPVVHILFNNLEDFLPLLDSSGSPKKTSVIYSLQISERKDHSRVLLEEPISLEFAFSSVSVYNT